MICVDSICCKLINAIIFAILLIWSAPSDVSAAESDLMGDWYLRNARDTTKSLDLRLTYCDSLLDMAGSGRNKDSQIDKVDILIMKGMLQKDNMRYDEAAECFSEALNHLPKVGGRYLDVLLHTGIVNRAKGDFSTAIRYFHQLLAMPKPDSMLYIDGSAYAFLSMICMQTGRYDLTKKYFDRADRIIAGLQDEKISGRKLETIICDISNAKGIFYLEVRDFQAARDNLKKALETSNEFRPHSVALVNLGLVYMLQNHSDVAEEYFKEGMKSLDSKYGVLLGVVNCMHIYLQQGRFDEVKALVDAYGPDIEHTTHHSLLATYFVNRSIIEEKNGNLGEALRYRNLLDSLIATEPNVEQVHKLQLQLDELLENSATERHPSFPWVWFICGLVLFLCLVILFIWAGYRKRLNVVRNEKVNLENALKTAESNAFESEQRYEELVARYEQFMEGEAGGKSGVFDSSLERKLALLHPSLTKNELELCSYLLRNMSAKQIAEESHRSVRTIESIKYSIRKKLATDESTYGYLRRIDTMSLRDVRAQLFGEEAGYPVQEGGS